MRRLVMVAAVLTLAVWSEPAVGGQQEGPDIRALDLTVMLRGRIGDEDTWGAGVVVGVREGRVYIATANHVVRSGGREATLEAQFRQLRGEWHRATVLSDFDVSLDLAVVTVATQDLRGSQPRFRFDLLGNAANLQNREEVYTVGFPNQRPWDNHDLPALFAEKRGSFVRFNTSYLAGGHSGGGLFNSKWELVGLVRADTPPRGEATAVDAVLESLRGWGYPVALVAAGSSAPAPDKGEPPPQATQRTRPPGLYLRRDGQKGECINSTLLEEVAGDVLTMSNLAGACLDRPLLRGNRLGLEHVNIGCRCARN